MKYLFHIPMSGFVKIDLSGHKSVHFWRILPKTIDKIMGQEAFFLARVMAR